MRLRNKFYTILVLLISSNFILGQFPIDSFRQLWQNEKLSDSLRLDAVHQLAKRGFLNSNPDSAYHYATLQLHFADSIDMDIPKAEAINTQGISFAMRGKMEEALVYFKNYLKISDSLNYDEGKAGGLYNVGNAYLNLGQRDEALVYYDQSLAINKRLKNKRTATRILHAKGRLLEGEGKFEEAIKNYKEVLALEEEMHDFSGSAVTHVSIGMVYKSLGKYKEAIETFTKGLKISEKYNDLYGQTNALMRIGLTYDIQNEHKKAIQYFEKARLVAETLGDLKGVANAVQSLGSSYQIKGEYLLALENFDKALVLYDSIGDLSNKAICLNNVSSCYLKLNDLTKAEENANLSLKIKNDIGYTKGLPSVLITLSEIEIGKGNIKNAENHAQQALKLAQTYKFNEKIQQSAQLLYTLNKLNGNEKNALRMYELYVSLRDSTMSEENHRALLEQEYQYNYEKQSLQDSLAYVQKTAIQEAKLAKQRSFLYSSLVGLVMLLALAWSIFQGKKRSDQLLLNILPAETAAELKQKGYAKSKFIDNATVMFTDIKDFTILTQQMSAEGLVSAMNDVFSAYDKIMDKYGVEKIKTIGDSYMAAGGVPSPQENHALNVVNACLDIQSYMRSWKNERLANGLPVFDVRIGIHSGPVIAGIVGIKKFQYDIWSDTVNTASRIESAGEPGKVNISETTYLLVKDHFDFEHRGGIEAKGKGMLNMYFVNKKNID